MITGNDPVTASHKHKDSFTYIPQYKIWLATV
jgi:phage/plasmid-associated DNA primase